MFKLNFNKLKIKLPLPNIKTPNSMFFKFHILRNLKKKIQYIRSLLKFQSHINLKLTNLRTLFYQNRFHVSKIGVSLKCNFLTIA